MTAIVSQSPVRLAIGVPIAAAIVLGLFILMERLIRVDEVTLDTSTTAVLADFLAEERDDNIKTTQRAKPKALQTADKPPPPPKLSSSKSDVNLPTPKIEGAAPTELKFDRVQQIELNPVVVSDRDAQPIRKIPAQYPDRAAERGTEGSCEVRFNVDARGKPKDIVAKCTDNVFVDSVTRAVAAQEFAPKIVNGRSVERSNVVQPFTFKLSR
jgi:protein TonB